MLILVIVLKFVTTDKIGRTWWRHHFEDKEIIKLPIFCLKTEVGGWKLACRGNLWCWFRFWCWNLKPLSKSIEFDDVIILKTMKTWKCQYVGNRIKYTGEIWHMEVIHNADFDYYIEIGNNWQIVRIWWLPHFEDRNKNMKLPISSYQISLGRRRHWKDDSDHSSCEPKVNNPVFFIFEVLSFLFLPFFFLYTFCLHSLGLKVMFLSLMGIEQIE